MSQHPSAPVNAPSEPANSPNTNNSAPAEDEKENWWDFCPNCGSRLHNRGCKYRCPRCHYFMSCSDFDQ